VETTKRHGADGEVNLQTHIADSVLIVDNYYFEDEDGGKWDVMFNLTMPHETSGDYTNDKARAEKRRKDRLNSPKRFCVDFTGTIDGYKVSAVFHPDETDSSVGMAVYHFKSRKNNFTVENGYYWNNWVAAFKGRAGKVKFNGDKGSVPIDPKALQGEGKRIENISSSPFVMKDMDFDGEKEILFRCFGYNRYYWNVCKVTGKNKAALMNGAYGNLVYGEGEDACTEFDYKHKTIYILESMGCCEFDETKFARKKNVVDKLDSMENLYHIERKLDRGMSFHRYYKKGVMTRYEKEMYQDNKIVMIKGIYNPHNHESRLDSVLLLDKDEKLVSVAMNFRKPHNSQR